MTSEVSITTYQDSIFETYDKNDVNLYRWFAAMDADSDDDFLLDLFTYECPLTGQKRVAGQPYQLESQPEKRMKLLVV